MKTFTPFIFLFLFFSTVLSAQTTYTSLGGDWFNAATWTPNGIPGAADTAIINTGTTTISDIVTVGGLYMSAGTISGDSNLTVTDSLSWTGGTISFSSASSALKAKFTIASSAKANVNGFCYINRCLVNEGEFYFLGKSLGFGNTYKAYFYNYGTIHDESNENGSISGKFGDWFVNYGKYIKTGTGSRTIGLTQFVNSGEVKVDAGKLILPAGYIEETGSYMVGKQAYLGIAGPRILSGPVRIEGMLESSGQYVISVNDTFDIKGEFIYNAYGWMFFNSGSTPLLDSSMISVGGNIVFRTGKKVIIDSLRTIYASGGVAANDSLVVRKYADLTAGTIGGGTGVVIFDEDAEVNISLRKYTTSNNFQGQIDNYGTIHWKEGTFNLMYKTNVGAPEFNNYGLFIDEVRDSYNIERYGISENPFFNNYGIYQKKSTFPSGFTNVNFVNKETGVLKGEGNIAFSIPMVNKGTVSPGDSVGILNLIAEYPSDTTTVVNIDLDGADRDEYDLLDIDGAATLKGTLNISLLNGYIPEEGELFEIMKFTSRTDTFDVVNGMNICNCNFFAVQYTDTSVRLEAYAVEPPQAVKDTLSARQDEPVEINVLANDTDPDGDTLTVIFVGDPAHGTAIVSGDSTITYTPETSFVGLDTMIYVIRKRSGCVDSSMVIVDVVSTAGIEELPFDSPNSFKIEQNYPNPFDGSTTFHFSIPEKTFVELRIYNIHGKLMKALVSKKLPVGSYSYAWETPELPGGMYIYRFSAGDFNQTGKMIKMK